MKNKFSLFFLVMLLLSLTACASMPSSTNTRDYVDSNLITAKIRTSLTQKFGPKFMHTVSITTYECVVQLSGFVKTKQQMNQAVLIAKSIRGVKQVENNLLVKK